MIDTPNAAHMRLQHQLWRSFSIAAAAFGLTLLTVLGQFALLAHGNLALGTYVAGAPLPLRVGLAVASFGALVLAATRGITVLWQADRAGYRDTGMAVLGFCLLGLAGGILLADLPTIITG